MDTMTPAASRRGPTRAHGGTPTRRRRTAAVGAAAVLLAVCAVLPWAAGLQTAALAGRGPSPAAKADRRVVVDEGDTIWDLARAHAPAGVHPTVYAREVMHANDVDPRRLRAGAVLRLPGTGSAGSGDRTEGAGLDLVDEAAYGDVVGQER